MGAIRRHKRGERLTARTVNTIAERSQDRRFVGPGATVRRIGSEEFIQVNPQQARRTDATGFGWFQIQGFGDQWWMCRRYDIETRTPIEEVNLIAVAKPRHLWTDDWVALSHEWDNNEGVIPGGTDARFRFKFFGQNKREVYVVDAGDEDRPWQNLHGKQALIPAAWIGEVIGAVPVATGIKGPNDKYINWLDLNLAGRTWHDYAWI